MNRFLATLALSACALVPAAAFACGDTMATANPEQLGLQASPQATPVPAAVAKAALPKPAAQAPREAKAVAPDKVKVASTR